MQTKSEMDLTGLQDSSTSPNQAETLEILTLLSSVTGALYGLVVQPGGQVFDGAHGVCKLECASTVGIKGAA
jgi:hypothetical protein